MPERRVSSYEEFEIELEEVDDLGIRPGSRRTTGTGTGAGSVAPENCATSTTLVLNVADIRA